jgi:gamma-glutamylcyclotransferase (GGCT)/AIG2-like uncharacterized protein YtfP
LIWYFAYGSNLCVDQMHARTGWVPIAADPSRIARLPGYRLAFNMRGENGQIYANIVCPGDYVLGVLYPCSPEILDKLDPIEKGYHRERIIAIDQIGQTTEATTYIADLENVFDSGTPSASYLERVLRGGRHHGFLEPYLHSIEMLGHGRSGGKQGGR